MTAATILYPVFVQVGLTFALLFWMGPARVGSIKRGEVKIKDIALSQNAWPSRIQQISNSYNNQFQLPILFYVLVCLILITRTIDPVLVGLAWTFVLTRLAHAFVHVTSNYVPHRFWTYVVGVIALAAMWIVFGAKVALEGV